MAMRQVIVALEGNIGVGKSTALNALRDLDDRLLVCTEPTALWGEHLRKLYEGRNRAEWALPMQLLALTTRAEDALSAHRAMSNNPWCRGIVTERSIIKSGGIFARSSDLTRSECVAYEYASARYARLLREEGCVPTHTIYLRASPAKCLDRIRRRGRGGEEGVTWEYLHALHALHDEEFHDADLIIDAGAHDREGVAKKVVAFVSALLA
jgi:deoxycitidine kinase